IVAVALVMLGGDAEAPRRIAVADRPLPSGPPAGPAGSGGEVDRADQPRRPDDARTGESNAMRRLAMPFPRDMPGKAAPRGAARRQRTIGKALQPVAPAQETDLARDIQQPRLQQGGGDIEGNGGRYLPADCVGGDDGRLAGAIHHRDIVEYE